MDGFLDAKVEGVGDEGVADADLVDPGDLLAEVGEVLQAEVVAGVEAEAALARRLGGDDEGAYGLFATGGVAAGVALGVEFDAVGARPGSQFDHHRVGIDEDADAYAVLFEFFDHVGEVALVLGGVPSGVAGEDAVGVGHEGDLSRVDFLDEVDETVGAAFRHPLGIALDVVFHPYQRLDCQRVGIADVAFVGTRVDGDALRAEALAVDGEFEHVGCVATAGVADGGHFVDIDAEFSHCKLVLKTAAKLRRMYGTAKSSAKLIWWCRKIVVLLQIRIIKMEEPSRNPASQYQTPHERQHNHTQQQPYASG